jgi:hypothetical protein
VAKKVGNYEIPFDDEGNQKHYPESWRGLQWRKNDPFQDTLTYDGYSRGRSAAYFNFKRSDGTFVVMFLKDFEELVTHMINGKVTGTFQFIKRGQNYGCTMVAADTPKTTS